jgi:protein SCO1/2
MTALRRSFVAILLALAGIGAGARALAPAPNAPDASLEQHLGATLPLELAFVDSRGAPVQLGDYFGKRPVLLVLGYYRCPNLCGLVMHSVLEALEASGLPRHAWRVVGIGIDPQETPADAAARQRVDLAYAAHLRSAESGNAPHSKATAAEEPVDLHLLVGTPTALAALAQQVGFGYAPDADADARTDDAGRASRYVHAAGFVVVTPQGRISRYLYGVRFDARELRLALDAAAAGRIGGPVLDRLLLLCAHFDPAIGRHSGAVMNLLRGIGLALVLALGGWAWRHRRTPERKAAP